MDKNNGDGDDRRALREYLESVGTSPEMIEQMMHAERVRDQRTRPAAVATVVEFEPLPKRHGLQRLYVVRWRREGRSNRSKPFRTYGRAQRFVNRLNVEMTTPGSVFNVRRGSKMQKSPVEWIFVDRVYIQPIGPQANTRTCESCGQEFVPLRSDARFCGATCRKRASRAQAMSRMISVT